MAVLTHLSQALNTPDTGSPSRGPEHSESPPCSVAHGFWNVNNEAQLQTRLETQHLRITIYLGLGIHIPQKLAKA